MKRPECCTQWPKLRILVYPAKIGGRDEIKIMLRDPRLSGIDRGFQNPADNPDAQKLNATV